jgi:RNA polymerase sigma factor (sigma-70 family)
MRTEQLSGLLRHLHGAALLGDGGGMADGELLESFLARHDQVAFEALVRRHGPMVWGVCRRVLRDTHDAEDAFQATFLVLIRKAASLAHPELLGNWLYGVAYRTALEARAAAARRRARERQVSEMPETEAPAADVRLDLRPVLDRELSRLPDRYRVPVVLCDLEGGTRKDVARRLGIPEGTLSGRLTTARRLLARRLARHGFAVSAGALAATLSPNVTAACLPAPLVAATVGAAGAAGQAATGVISAEVLSLSERVVRAMSVTRLKVATAVLLGLVLAGSGLALWRPAPGAAQPSPAGRGEKPPGDGAGDPAPPARDWKERHSLSRNGDNVSCVALSPDGKTCAQGDSDGTVTFWDADTGKQGASIKVRLPHVRAVAFSPDGKTLAVAEVERGKPARVSLWDVAAAKEKGVLLGHTEPVLSVAYSPDGKTLATASADKTVRLWDAATGKERATLQGHTEAVYAVAFSPDGKTLATAGGKLLWHPSDVAPGEVKLWKADTGTEQASLRGHEDVVTSLAFSGDGATLVTGSYDRTAVVWDVPAGKKRATLKGHQGKVWAVAISPDGKTVVTGGEDEQVKLWDAASGKEVGALRGHDGRITALAFSADGKRLATGNGRRWGEENPGKAELKLWEAGK